MFDVSTRWRTANGACRRLRTYPADHVVVLVSKLIANETEERYYCKIAFDLIVTKLHIVIRPKYGQIALILTK